MGFSRKKLKNRTLHKNFLKIQRNTFPTVQKQKNHKNRKKRQKNFQRSQEKKSSTRATLRELKKEKMEDCPLYEKDFDAC